MDTMETEKPDTFGINKTGDREHIFKDVTLGFPSRENVGKENFTGVTIGDNFSSGHSVMSREKTTIRDNVSVGSSVIIEVN